MEKFVPISDGTTSGSGGSLNYRCKKCRMVFNSNEKVMEKHYFANHEFRYQNFELSNEIENLGDEFI